MRTIIACICLALLSAAPQSHAVQYFQYDKADETIRCTSLDKPLFYDASVVSADGKTYVTWLEFQPSKRDLVWFGIRDAANKWLEKKQITLDSADCANPTLTRDKAGNTLAHLRNSGGRQMGRFRHASKSQMAFSPTPTRVSNWQRHVRKPSRCSSG